MGVDGGWDGGGWGDCKAADQVAESRPLHNCCPPLTVHCSFHLNWLIIFTLFWWKTTFMHFILFNILKKIYEWKVSSLFKYHPLTLWPKWHNGKFLSKVQKGWWFLWLVSRMMIRATRVFKNYNESDSDEGDVAANIECKRGSRTETMSWLNLPTEWSINELWRSEHWTLFVEQEGTR